MKHLLIIIMFSFPAFGKEFSLLQHPPDTTAHRFELPLSAPDAANEIPNRDTIEPERTLRIPSVYRTTEESSKDSPNEHPFSLKGLSLYKSASATKKPAKQSLTTRLVEVMREKYRGIVTAAARSSSVITEEVIYAVMWVECNGEIRCTSSAGAEGPMQINAITQRELGLKPGEAFIPKKAIPKAAEYLETNYEKFGNLPSALLAYGIGPGNARVYLRKKKDPSRHPYVKKVLSAQSLM